MYNDIAEFIKEYVTLCTKFQMYVLDVEECPYVASEVERIDVEDHIKMLNKWFNRSY